MVSADVTFIKTNLFYFSCYFLHSVFFCLSLFLFRIVYEIFHVISSQYALALDCAKVRNDMIDFVATQVHSKVFQTERSCKQVKENVSPAVTLNESSPNNCRNRLKCLSHEVCSSNFKKKSRLHS